MPARLTGAIDNSLSRWDDLLDVMESVPDVWDGLATSELLVRTEGRPRMPGQWALAFILYANSAERELLRWYRHTPDELWTRTGFVMRPSYQAVYKNFNALEDHEAAFRAVAATFTQLAVERSGGKVGHAVHVDGTEAEAHSRLVHDCRGDEVASCKKQVLTPNRATNADARSERHRLAEEVPTDDELYGAADDMAADEEGLRVKVGDCWYLLSDDEAGIRAYVGANGKLRKFWAGYYCFKAVDHYTGAVLAVHVTNASVQEHIGYDGLYEQTKQQIGQAPRAVVADRGFSVRSVFEKHTRGGVASVIPWRTHWHEDERKEYERHDRHGIPRCKHCGGEGVFHRFQHDAGPSKQPRLWFTCARPGGSECEAVQSIMCSTDWRLLLPLWRTSPAYLALRASHNNYEAAHHRWRERYAVAGETKADRPKRRGIGVQQLRASASLIIEWLTVCHRQGRLPGGVLLNERAETTIPRHQVEQFARSLRVRLQALGLTAVETALVSEHQADVLASYGSSTSSFGATSAHGPAITKMLEGEGPGSDGPSGEVSTDDSVRPDTG